MFLPTFERVGSGMDPRQILEQEWPVIVGAPVLALGLLALGAVVGWWFRGQKTEGEIAGLKTQLAVRDERSTYAKEQSATEKGFVEAATAKLVELSAQQQRGAAPQQIALTTEALTKDIARVTTANAEIYNVLSAPDFTKMTPEDMLRAIGAPAPRNGNGL